MVRTSSHVLVRELRMRETRFEAPRDNDWGGGEPIRRLRLRPGWDSTLLSRPWSPRPRGERTAMTASPSNRPSRRGTIPIALVAILGLAAASLSQCRRVGDSVSAVDLAASWDASA